MNLHCLLTVAGVVLLLAGGGCQPSAYEPSTQAEAQQIYSRTKWYFARPIAFSKLAPAPRTPDMPRDSHLQTVFDLASGTRITYSEYLPSSGLKAFQGHGWLESIPQVAGPIYRLENSHTAEHPDAVLLVGFCGNRRFVVQARGTNQPTVLADALSLATNALVNLRSQALHPQGERGGLRRSQRPRRGHRTSAAQRGVSLGFDAPGGASAGIQRGRRGFPTENYRHKANKKY